MTSQKKVFSPKINFWHGSIIISHELYLKKVSMIAFKVDGYFLFANYG